MKELRDKIQVWYKENEDEYYGLDRDGVRSALSELEDALDKIEEMQKTLEFYGNADSWELPSFGRGHSAAVSDRGEHARQALKGETQ